VPLALSPAETATLADALRALERLAARPPAKQKRPKLKVNVTLQVTATVAVPKTRRAVRRNVLGRYRGHRHGARAMSAPTRRSYLGTLGVGLISYAQQSSSRWAVVSCGRAAKYPSTSASVFGNNGSHGRTN
jgi:hypothetical protein